MKNSAPKIPELISVALFGSRARGDDDKHSDTDLCIIVERSSPRRFGQIKAQIASHYGLPKESISIYTQTSIDAMKRHSSLFLWHLKLEGKIWYDENDYLANTLQDLQPFTGYDEEMGIYERLLSDVKMSLDKNGVLEIDLHIMQVVIRNICILLTYQSGQPSFGRKGAFFGAKKLYPAMPVDRSTYDALCYWHILYTRGFASSKGRPKSSQARRFLLSAKALMRFANKRFGND
jgi:predicted nucleotidyltransferase